MIYVDDYKVEWQYDSVQPQDRFMTTPNITSRCNIYSPDGVLKATGEAVKSQGDVHDKEIARKVTLKRALEHFTKEMHVEPAKKLRSKFWDAYFSR